MSKKKLIICITTIFILMICSIFIIYIVKNKNQTKEPTTNITEKKDDNKNDKTNKEKTIKENSKTTIENEKIDEEIKKEETKEEINQENKDNKNNNQNTKTNNTNKNTNSNSQQQQNNNSNNNNSNSNQEPTPTPVPTPTPDPTPEPEPVITYYCPEGYNLDDTQCTSIISADYVCPNGTYDYSDEGIPRDTFCVNLSEGYETEDTCPDGYGSLAIISLGAPTINKCFPLHRKIYVCNDGYNLNGTNCIRTINAETK